MEEKMNGFFKGVTNKEAGYDGMFLRDDFTFGIAAADGSRPNMDQISAGEKQVVAFSFILGLNQYARAKAPLMIDTPMSRLDQEHRRNLAETIARMPQQVFMFVTDTDLGFGVDEIVADSVAAEFRIVQDPRALTSTITPEGRQA
jgi:DNA sulfur modification protein DndD